MSREQCSDKSITNQTPRLVKDQTLRSTEDENNVGAVVPTAGVVFGKGGKEVVLDGGLVQLPSWDYHALVLSGGGIRGIAMLGALNVLEEHNCLKDVHIFVGTSIGALICALFSIGYTAEEICKEMWNINLNDLRHVDIWNFFNSFGLDTGDKIVETLQSLFKKKDIKPTITLEQLYKDRGITLVVTGTLVNEHRLDIFSYKTHPKCRVIDAVRISTSIPFLFAAPKFENNYYSDGGLLDNYPISCLKDYISDHETEHILGVKLIHQFSLKGRVQINPYEFPKFAKHLVYTAIDEINRLRNIISNFERPYPNLVTIEINTEGIGSMPVNMDEKDRKQLYMLGQYYTACWLEKTIDEKRDELFMETPISPSAPSVASVVSPKSTRSPQSPRSPRSQQSPFNEIIENIEINNNLNDESE